MGNMSQFRPHWEICRIYDGSHFLSFVLWRLTVMIGRYDGRSYLFPTNKQPLIFWFSILGRFVLMTWER